MPPPISWSALADASVGVWGLGVEGRASLRRLQSMGHLPVLVDDTPAEPSIDGLEVLATAPGGLDALLRCDVVVKSPGISRYRPEVAQLESSASRCAAVSACSWRRPTRPAVACVTGTKGKSTTTALAVHLLERLGYRARAGGNIGHPPWDTSPEPAARLLDRRDVELPGPGPDDGAAGRRGHLAVPGPSRLARHGGPLLRRQALPVHQARRQPRAGRRVRRRAAGPGRALGPHLRWVGETDVAGTRPGPRALGLRGPHNARNASVARAVLAGLGIPAASDPARAGRGGRGLRRAAQPLLLARIGPRGRVRRRQPGDERVADAGRAGGVRRPARCVARRRTRSRGGLRTTGRERRHPDGPDAGGHHARQRATHRCGGPCTPPTASR